MKNGRYEITIKGTGSKFILKVKSGEYRMYNETGKIFIKYLREDILKDLFTVKTLQPEPKLYDIQYWINGSVKETIPMNASYPVCVHRINQIKQSYSSGLLKPILHT